MSIEYNPRGLASLFSGDRLRKREGEAICDTCGVRFCSGQDGLGNIIEVHDALRSHLGANPGHAGRISEDSCGNIVAASPLRRKE